MNTEAAAVKIVVVVILSGIAAISLRWLLGAVGRLIGSASDASENQEPR